MKGNKAVQLLGSADLPLDSRFHRGFAPNYPLCSDTRTPLGAGPHAVLFATRFQNPGPATD